MNDTTEMCSNCDRKIGRLETPMLWGGNVVCKECHQRLGPAADEVEETAAPSPTSPTACPSCGSDHTMKCSAAFESGTTSGSFTGFTIGDSDNAMLGSSSSQTMLAKRCAPPKEPASAALALWVLAAILLGLAWLLYVISRDSNGASMMTVIAALLVIGCVGAVYGALKANGIDRKTHEEWLNDRANWGQLWVCTRCTRQFLPKRNTPT